MTDDRTILIIDDCAEDRENYRRFLGRCHDVNYSFLEADCAESAFECLQASACDLILLDFCLPGSNGLEFLKDLKQQHAEFSTPIIMLTGHGGENIAVEAMKWGVHDYLMKNHLQADVLQLAVRNVLQKNLLKAQLSHIRERQRLTATTALRIRQSLNLEEILNTAVAEVQQILRCERVAIYEFSNLQSADSLNRPIMHSCQSVDLTSSTAEQCDWCCASKDQPIETCMKGKIRAISRFDGLGFDQLGLDEANLTEVFHLQPDFANHNLVAEIIIAPQNPQSSDIWGILVAHQHYQQRQWRQDEQEILQEVAVQLAIAIQQAELLQQTQQALDREKELNHFKSQIIATVSHEYRTPLTAIWAAASTLKLHGEQLNPDRQHRCLEIIEQKSKRLKQLVEDMLTIEHCETSQFTFKPIPIELIPLMSGVVDEQQDMAGQDYELLLNIRGSCKGFRGDPQLLRLIFSNLIANAVKYTPNGGTISIGLSSNRSEIQFSVEDAGIGIPMTEQAALFQEFKRGSNVDTIPGLGLGLTIARSCVEMHGGTINLTSQPKKGTKVTVRFPKKVELTQNLEITSSEDPTPTRIYDFQPSPDLAVRKLNL